MALSGVAQAGASTSTAASPTKIDYVCVNKSSGQLFYLASCTKSQTSTSVTSSSTPFKACFQASNGVTRKVPESTKCSNKSTNIENTIENVPADSTSLYFCVKSSDGTMYFKPGTTEPTCPTGQYAVVIGSHNQAPAAAGNSYNVAEDGTLSVPAPGVLSNDSDPDGDTITAQLATGPSHGTLTLNSDGSFSYTHDGGDTTSDSFSYKASDGKADSNVATATITVNQADAQCKTLARQTLGSSFNASNYTFHGSTAAGDNFTGTDGQSEVFCGFGGDDSIATLQAGDIFLGGDGNDYVTDNRGTYYGGADNDRVDYNYGTFNGEAGNDSVYDSNFGTFNGGDGNDTIDTENDGTFWGGEGDDHVYINFFDSTFNGEAGDDYVTDNEGTFNGGDGNDSVDINQGTTDSVENGV